MCSYACILHTWITQCTRRLQQQSVRLNLNNRYMQRSGLHSLCGCLCCKAVRDGASAVALIVKVGRYATDDNYDEAVLFFFVVFFCWCS